MPRSVGESKLPPWRGEIAVGDVDGNALFLFGAKSVGQEREIGCGITPALACQLHGCSLVLENGLGIVKQASKQGALAIVDIAAGDESQEILSSPK